VRAEREEPDLNPNCRSPTPPPDHTPQQELANRTQALPRQFNDQGDPMSAPTVLFFTRNGMGHGPADLQQKLVAKYLSLTLESGDLPAQILFYTDGVRLACQGSPVLDQLRAFEAKGVELVLCSTCLDFFELSEKVEVGIVGGMGDILTALQKAGKIIPL
jgi:hypothetical protein